MQQQQAPILFYGKDCENSRNIIGLIKQYPFLNLIRPVCVDDTDNLPQNLEYTPTILAQGKMFAGSEAFGFVQMYIKRFLQSQQQAQQQQAQQAQQQQQQQQTQQRSAQQQGSAQQMQQGQGGQYQPRPGQGNPPMRDNKLPSEQTTAANAMQRSAAQGAAAAAGIQQQQPEELDGFSLMSGSGSLAGVSLTSFNGEAGDKFDGSTSDTSSTNYMAITDFEKSSAGSIPAQNQNGGATNGGRRGENQQADATIKNLENERNRDIPLPSPRQGGGPGQSLPPMNNQQHQQNFPPVQSQAYQPYANNNQQQMTQQQFQQQFQQQQGQQNYPKVAPQKYTPGYQ
jgi:hypothetical protein